MANEGIIKNEKKPEKSLEKFHSHRTPDCDRDHCDPRLNAAAGLEQSEGKSQVYKLHVQFETDGNYYDKLF